MKKISYLLVLVAVVLIFSGCGKKSETDQAGDLKKEDSAGSKVVSSIKDAMGLGQKMECAYAMGVGEEKFVSTVWTEGKKYRGESVVAGKKNFSLFDGEDLMYNWSEDSQTGTKISIKCMEGLKDFAPQKETTPEEGDLPPVKDLGDDAFNDVPSANCQPVASIDFSLPTEVTFTDQCEELKTQMESIKKMQENLPNINLPGGVNIPEIPTDIPADARL